jgi:hypothetical protein
MALSQVVNSLSTATALMTSPNPSNLGQTVTLTATVMAANSATPTGSVTFYNGAALAGSTSTAVSQVVNQAGTATVLATTPNPSSQAQAVGMTATVMSSTSAIPTGSNVLRRRCLNRDGHA